MFAQSQYVPGQSPNPSNAANASNASNVSNPSNVSNASNHSKPSNYFPGNNKGEGGGGPWMVLWCVGGVTGDGMDEPFCKQRTENINHATCLLIARRVCDHETCVAITRQCLVITPPATCPVITRHVITRDVLKTCLISCDHKT